MAAKKSKTKASKKGKDKKSSAKKGKVEKKTAKKKKTASQKATKKKVTKKKTAKKVAKKSTSTKSVAKKSSVKKTTKKSGVKKTTVKKTTKKAPVKKTAGKKAAKKTASKKTTAKKTTGPKTTGKKSATNKTPAKAAAPAKVSISIDIGDHKRSVAPGVRIEKIAAVESGVKKKKSVPRLSPKQIEAVKEKLMEKRSRIISEMRNQIDDSINRNSSVKTDAADRASDVYDGDVSYKMALLGHQELKEIDAALDKIDNGTYGKCESCGKHIGTPRLKVKPFASYCAGCRQTKESSNISNGDGNIWGYLDPNSSDDDD
jgi:RNA polymerase-binding protein DksA